jgi:branched-chain amino acid aminotransferase
VALLVETGAYEAILVNRHGIITEASRSNIFFTKGNVIYTTEASHVLPGITRKKVLEVCSLLKMDVKFVSIKVDELKNYDSCFLTGTARKIVPIRVIEDTRFDAENPLVQKISLEFEKLVAGYISQNKV